MPNHEKKIIQSLKPFTTFFERKDKRLFNGKVCIPINSVSILLIVANSSKVRGHVKFAKTKSWLSSFC